MVESSISGEPVMIPDGRPFREMARSVAGYIVMLAFTLIPPFVIFIPAVLISCGVRNGRRAAALALLLLAALALFLAVQPDSHASHGDAKLSLSYVVALVLAMGVPSLVLIPMVARRETFRRIITVVLVGAALGLGATEVVSRQTMSFSPYQAQLEQSRGLSDEFIKTNSATGEREHFARLAADIGLQSAGGMLLVDIALIFVFSLLIVGRLWTWRRFVQQRSAGEIGPFVVTPYLFRLFSLPDWLLFAFVAGGVAPFVHGLAQSIGANLLAVTLCLYFVQGLAIFRFILAAKGLGLIGSTLAFAMAGIVFWISIPLLTVAGLFDSFFDFRHFNRKDDSNESHID